MGRNNTPYDDVFRTLLADCPRLVIPLINEIFGENYSGEERIEFFQNELFLEQEDGEQSERITDSSFSITKEGETQGKRYHLECQSTPDGSMIIRMFEYGILHALKNRALSGAELVVRLPESAVLYLRHRRNTPDILRIRLETPGGAVSYEVPVVKVQTYSIDDLFAKNLLFLIPFYIFCHEAELAEIAEDEGRLERLKQEYAGIRQKLEKCVENGLISEYVKRAILTMAESVVSSVAIKHKKIKEGVSESMGGKVLNYEAKDILNRGKAQGLMESLNRLMKNLSIDLSEACRLLGITEEDYELAKSRL